MYIINMNKESIMILCISIHSKINNKGGFKNGEYLCKSERKGCRLRAWRGRRYHVYRSCCSLKDSKESKKRTKVLNDIRREQSADHAEILQKQDDLQKQSAIHKVCGMAVAVNHGTVMPVDQEALRAEVGQSAHTPQQPAPQTPFTAPAPATAPVQEPVQQATPAQQGQPVNINVATAPAQQPAPQQNGVDVNAIIAAVLNNPEYKAALNAAVAAPKQEEAPAAPVEEKKEEEPKKEAPATTSNNKKK